MNVEISELVFIPAAAAAACLAAAILRKIFGFSRRKMTVAEMIAAASSSALYCALTGRFDFPNVAFCAAAVAGIALSVCGIFCNSGGEGAEDIALGRRLIEAALSLAEKKKSDPSEPDE